MVDLEVFLSQMSPGNSAKAAELDLNSVSAFKRESITALLSMLMTFGINEEIDRICHDRLKIPLSRNAFGLCR